MGKKLQGKFHHLTFTDRLRIEMMLKEGKSKTEIARRLGKHHSTIYDEVKRGAYERLNSDYTTEIGYSPEIAEQKYRESLAAKGPDLKIGNDHALARFLEKKIADEGFSPSAAVSLIGKTDEYEGKTKICRATCYKYIDMGIFGRLTNKDLPQKGKRKRKYNQVRPARAPRGESIERRPEEINERGIAGHWEMDCVEGKKGTRVTLLVLTERVTRMEIIIKMPNQTAASVVDALDRIERRMGAKFQKVFRSITVDNGSEFSDCTGMERSCRRRGKRTQVYYCHPYSAWERGSNEKQNQIIRRHLPKGTDFRKVSNRKIRYVMDWINNYPRFILGWKTSAELFTEAVEQLCA